MDDFYKMTANSQIYENYYTIAKNYSKVISLLTSRSDIL